MRGSLWIVSYFVLTPGVLWLTLAVIGLHRRLESVHPSPAEWPSRVLYPGSGLPSVWGSALDDPSSARPLTSGGADFILCLVSHRAEEGYGAILSAAAIANEYDIGLVIAMEAAADHRIPHFARMLPVEIRTRALAVPASQFKQFGLRAPTAIGIVREGTLRHLIGRVANPYDLRHYLGFFFQRPTTADFRSALRRQCPVRPLTRRRFLGRLVAFVGGLTAFAARGLPSAVAGGVVVGDDNCLDRIAWDRCVTSSGCTSKSGPVCSYPDVCCVKTTSQNGRYFQWCHAVPSRPGEYCYALNCVCNGGACACSVVCRM